MPRPRRAAGGGAGGSASRRNRARHAEDDDDGEFWGVDEDGGLHVPPEFLDALYAELKRRERWRPRRAGDPPEPLFTLLQLAAAAAEWARDAWAAAAAWLRLDDVPFGANSGSGGGGAGGDGGDGGASGAHGAGGGPSSQPGGPEQASGGGNGGARNAVADAFAHLGFADGAEGVSAEAVRSAFRRLSLGCHPDKCVGDAGAPARFAALAAARDAALKHLAGGGASDDDDANAANADDAAAEAAEAATPRARAARRDAAAAARRAEEEEVVAERARIRAAEAAAAAAAASRAGAAALRSRRAAWEARVREVEAELKRCDDAAFRMRGAENPKKRRNARRGGGAPSAAPPDTPQDRAARRAAAEDYAGAPPAPLPPTCAEDAFASCAAGVAVAIRARAPRHLYSLLQVFAAQGQLHGILTADLGCGTRALHHAAHAAWAEGVDLIISFAGGGYAEIVLARDDQGRTPADVAAARCDAVDVGGGDGGAGDARGVAARLRELEAHAEAARDAETAAAATALRAAAAAAARGLLMAPLRLSLLTGRVAYALARRMLGY
jgi:hypothetical protein